MKKRKSSLLQRMMAVLLSAVLVTGMVSNAAPLRVLAEEPEETQEDVSGNTVETEEGDITPEEETDSEGQEPETEDTGETVPEEPEEVTEQETVSGNDVTPEIVAEPQRVMRMAAPVAQTEDIVSGNCGENLTWKLENNVLTISGSGNMNKYSKNAPFLSPWNDNKTDIVSVVIESGVTSIGDAAFYGCGSLTSITIADSVTSIGMSAFEGCSSLTSITIPENVTIINWATFYDCSSLKSITIPKKVTSIELSAFNGCRSLESIEIPSSVTSIEFMAFAYCSNLASVTMKGGTPPKLDSSVFDGCKFVTDKTKGILVPSGTAQDYKGKWTTWAAYITDGTHEHSWATGWGNDATHHWHNCTASGCTVTNNAEKKDYGAHVYDNDSDITCNICGYKRTVEITGISVECDLTSARDAQIGDKIETPSLSISSSPSAICSWNEWWQRREGNGFTKYEGSEWEEGVYVREVRLRSATQDMIFAAEPQITSLNGEHWTVVERSNDNKIIILRSDEIVKAHTHEYGDWQKNDTQHWKVCSCGAENGRANHDFGDWITDQAATATQAGTKHRDCRTCGYKETGTIPATGESHTHEYGDWQKNDTQHWKACSCGNEIDKANHDFGDWITDQEATAAEEGTKHRDCQTCGYRETETIPKTGGGSSSGDNGGSSGNQGGSSSGDHGSSSGGNQGSSSGGSDQNDSSGGSNSGAGGSSAGGSGSTTSGGSATATPGKPGNSGTGQPRVKQEKEGNIQKEIRVEGEAALDAAITATLPELADIVLSETEKQQAADGTNISIVLDVKDVSAVISAADKTVVETALNGSLAKGYTLGQYLDISLYKVIGDSRSAITQTGRKITVTIQVPDSLKNTDGTKRRTFAVIRVHDGKAVLLPDLDNNADTITIETDRFSTYAIVYQDTEGENGTKPDSSKDNEPKTGDSTPLELCATLSMIAGFAYLLLYFTDHRHGMTEETKKELVSRIVAWAKQGGKIRKYLALAAIFVLLVYYHSIGKKTCVGWKEVYGE